MRPLLPSGAGSDANCDATRDASQSTASQEGQASASRSCDPILVPGIEEPVAEGVSSRGQGILELTRCLCYKTFYVSNLQTFVIS
jgi:hypothetical protein